MRGGSQEEESTMVLQHGHVVGVYVILLQILLIACQQRRKHTLSETRYDTLSTNLISFRPTNSTLRSFR